MKITGQKMNVGKAVNSSRVYADVATNTIYYSGTCSIVGGLCLSFITLEFSEKVLHINAQRIGTSSTSDFVPGWVMPKLHLADLFNTVSKTNPYVAWSPTDLSKVASADMDLSVSCMS